MKTGNQSTTKNISNVFYKDIYNDTDEVAKLFFYLNFTGSIFDEEFEKYEANQIKYRNSLIGNAIINGEVPEHIDMNSVIYGLSSLKNKSVIIVEY